MSKPWTDMAGREQDETLAVAMGWTQHFVPPYGVSWVKPDGTLSFGTSAPYLPPFTTSFSAIRIAEDAIEERDLEDAYIDALMQIVGFSAVGATTRDFWVLLRATPAQRAEAAYRVLTERG